MERSRIFIAAVVVYAAMAGSWFWFTGSLLPRLAATGEEASRWTTFIGVFNLSVTFLIFFLGTQAFIRLRCNRCHAFLEAANDGILLYSIDAAATIYVNGQTCRMYGYSANDFYRRGPLIGCLDEPPFSCAEYREYLLEAARGVPQRFEWQALHRDGHPLWTEVSLQTVSVRGAEHLLAVVRDITGPKQVERTLTRLNRTLTMLVVCNEVLVRAEREEELLQRVCRAIREVGGYRLASIALASGDRLETVIEAAQDCCEPACPSAPAERDRPAVAAMLEKLPHLIKDVRNELRCSSPPWRGCRHCSVLAVPLLAGTETLGALTVDAAEPDAFDAEEVKLMVQLADNISFGIASLRTAAERTRIEEALKSSEHNLVEAQSIAHLGSWEFDVLRCEERRSAEFYRILGLPPEVGRCARDSVFDYIHPEDRETVAVKLFCTLQNGGPYEVDYRIVRPDGTQRAVHAQGKGVTDASGHVVKFIGTVLDVTERRQAQEELQASERRFRELLEKVRLAAMTLDTDGTVTFCNEFLLGLTGWRREEVLGANWFDVFVPPQLREVGKAYFRRKVASGDIRINGDRPIVTRDGRVRNVAWDISVLHGADNSVTGIAGVGIDVTDQRALEEQLRQSQKMEAVGQMAGGIAHDFNNILSVICGYGEIMQGELPPDHPQQENLAQIMMAGDRAAKLIHSLLAFSRKEVMEPEIDNLNRIVRSVEQFLPRIIGEDICIRTIRRHERIVINADAGQIEQLLINLATNARDAMPKGGHLIIETRLEVVADEQAKAYGCPPGLYAILSVADTGCGMDQETRRKIFEPFFTTKEVNKGTGLGLAIVYGIVSQHGGYISVSSEPGQGTVFTILIPALENEVARAHELPQPAAPEGGGETVLVVEDDPAVRRLIESTLTRSGYRVLLAEDGQDAVERYREQGGEIELVIMDLIMPRKSGREAYREIRELDPEVKVLFASGYSADFIESRGALEEGVELLRKPVQPNELLRKMREVLSA